MELDEIKQRIELAEGDVTEMEVDAIVNSANTDLILGTGVAAAIGRKGGKVIQEECDRIGSVEVGEAVVTTAGALKAKYIIHAASMEVGHFATERNIARATRSALQRAEELHVQTIAFPAIGTGAAAFPVHHCARVMFDVVVAQLAAGSSLRRVYFVLYDAEALETFREVFEQLGAVPPPVPRERRPRNNAGHERPRGREHGRPPQPDRQRG
jgi:O-acetyl-ADP-ribose deacetylase (regulator of RNase III)